MERLQRHRNPLGETDADEAAGRDGVAVAYQADRFLGGDDLASCRGPQNLCELRLSSGRARTFLTTDPLSRSSQVVTLRLRRTPRRLDERDDEDVLVRLAVREAGDREQA